MTNLAFYGEIENGHIALPENVRLPDKSKVYVTVSEVDAAPHRLSVRSPRVTSLEQAARLKKEIRVYDPGPDTDNAPGQQTEAGEHKPKTMVYVPKHSEGPRRLRMPTPRVTSREQADRLKKEMVGIEEDDEL